MASKCILGSLHNEYLTLIATKGSKSAAERPRSSGCRGAYSREAREVDRFAVGPLEAGERDELDVAPPLGEEHAAVGVGEEELVETVGLDDRLHQLRDLDAGGEVPPRLV